ncbi:Protein ssh4 [Dispira simplex]|nr:Protein ssh4 [Dispira simplex]
MLQRLVKEHQTKQSATRKENEQLRNEANQHIKQLSSVLTENVQQRVNLVLRNQQELEKETTRLSDEVNQYTQQTRKWLRSIHEFNDAAKRGHQEVGSFKHTISEQPTFASERARLQFESAQKFETMYSNICIPTRLTQDQYVYAEEYGVNAWQFVTPADPHLGPTLGADLAPKDLHQLVRVRDRTEVEFLSVGNQGEYSSEPHQECLVHTNFPLPWSSAVGYFEVKLMKKPDQTNVAIGLASKPYPTVNLGQRGFVFIEANVKRWGLGSIEGNSLPPPKYADAIHSILLASTSYGESGESDTDTAILGSSRRTLMNSDTTVDDTNPLVTTYRSLSPTRVTPRLVPVVPMDWHLHPHNLVGDFSGATQTHEEGSPASLPMLVSASLQVPVPAVVHPALRNELDMGNSQFDQCRR